MSIVATPTLTVAGLPVALGGPASLVGIDALRVTWGRASVFEQPNPATAAVAVLDRTAAATFARRTDLIGQPVVIGWTSSSLGATGTIFRGRITDVSAQPRAGAVAGAGFRVALAASSVEVDLGNYTVPEHTTWPQESVAARLARITALIPAGMLPGGVVLPTQSDVAGPDPANIVGTGQLVAAADVSGRSVLELLRGLFLSLSPLPMVYDPGAQRLTCPARRRYGNDVSRFISNGYGGGYMTFSGRLVASPDHGGRYVAADLGGHHLDAAHLGYAGTLEQTLDSRITRVEVSYADAAAAADQTVAWATVDTPLESTIGRRTLAVSSQQSDSFNVAQTAAVYADYASREARAPRLGSLSWSSKREPLHDNAHAATLLAGTEGDRSVGNLFLGRSWLPQLGQSPQVGIFGSTVGYAAGEWTVDFAPAPVVIDPGSFRWAPVTAPAAAVPTVKASQLDPSVTFGDIGFIDVGAGFTTATQPSYQGNP